MRTIGLLGGMSWQSSVEYERLINTEVQRRLGGVASADMMIRSYNFQDIETMQAADDWSAAGRLLAADAAALESAGASVIALCTNTMHEVADMIEGAISVPFVHIAEATALAVGRAEVSSVGLLGTRYTMERDFYIGKLESHGLDVLVPTEPDRTVVHDVIFDELVRGEIVAASRHKYLAIIDRLIARGAAGIIAGCTEIELLVKATDISVPYFPTTEVHAQAIVNAAFR